MSANRMDRCEELQSQLAAYALGERDPDLDLLTHLARCADCWGRLHSYAHVTQMLLYSAPQVEPAPELRDRILAAANGARPPARPFQPRASISRQSPRWRMSPVLCWSAAVATLLALLGWNASLQSRLNSQTVQLDRLTQQVANSRANWQTMTRVLNRADLDSYALAGGAATGRFWTSPDLDVACLVAEGLPDPGANNVYRVWLLEGNTTVPIGQFVPQQGSGWVILRIDRSLSAYQKVDVTIEPRNNNNKRTGKQVLTGVLTLSSQPQRLPYVETITFSPYQELTN